MAASMGSIAQLGMDASSTTSTEAYEFTAISLKIDENLFDAGGMRGTREHVSERVRQNTRAPGLTVTLQPNSVELDSLLPRILGTAEVADLFALGETLPTFVVNVDAVTKRYHFTGCTVNRARFYSTHGGPLNLDLDIEALDVAESATVFPTLTISTVGPYIHSDVAIVVNSQTLKWRDFSLTVDNMLDTGRFFNSQTRQTLPTRDRTITWSLNGPYGDNQVLYGLAAAGVACTATYTLANRSLLFSSTKVAFPRELPAFNGKEEIMLPLNGVARKDGSTLSLVTTNDSTP